MNISSLHGAPRTDANRPRSATGDPTSLLPSVTRSVDGFEDALAMITALSEKQRTASEKSSKLDITQHHDKQAHLRQEAFEQRERAREAEATGGVFKTLALVGSVAATAATLGSAAPVAVAVTAAALSASSLIVSETKCFGESSNAVAMALGLGAGCVSGGAALLGLAGTTSTALQATAKAVGAAGTTTQGLSRAGASAADYIAANHAVDATAAQFEARRENTKTDECIASLQDLQKSHERTVSLLHEARAIHQQTSVLISGSKV